MRDEPIAETRYPWDEISPEEEELVTTWHECCRQAIVGLLMSRGESFRKTSSRAGYSAAYLSRIKTGGRNLTLRAILKVLASFKLPLDLYLRRVIELCPREDAFDNDGTLLGSPADLLVEWRESKVDPPEPFLEQIAAAFIDIEFRELSSAAPEAHFRPLVLALEGERIRDWRVAKAKLEVMGLYDLLPLLQQEPISRASLADLAILLAAWSATQRVAGFRGHAISGLVLALRSAQRSRDVWAQGFCLQKAAYLAHDLGHDIEGLAFIRMAALCFLEDGDADDHARVMVDRGYIAFYCGRLDEAERLFRAGISKLGPHLWIYQLAAHQGMSAIARSRSQLDVAIDWLERAAAICEGASVDLAHVRLMQARILQDAGSAEQAIAACRQSIAIFSEKGNACDVAWVALLLAELLISTGRRSALAGLSRDLSSWLPSLAENSVVQIAIENFMARLRLGDLSLRDIGLARSGMAKAGFANPA